MPFTTFCLFCCFAAAETWCSCVFCSVHFMTGQPRPLCEQRLKPILPVWIVHLLFHTFIPPPYPYPGYSCLPAWACSSYPTCTPVPPPPSLPAYLPSFLVPTPSGLDLVIVPFLFWSLLLCHSAACLFWSHWFFCLLVLSSFAARLSCITRSFTRVHYAVLLVPCLPRVLPSIPFYWFSPSPFAVAPSAAGWRSLFLPVTSLPFAL